jgi:predicted DNA-binding transcriptional regulator AlpA
MSAHTLRMARQLLADPDQTVNQVCQVLQVSRSTLYRYLKADPKNPGGPEHAGRLSHS